jgi:hypothetical protein
VIALDPSTGGEIAELAPLDTWSDVSLDPSGAHWGALLRGSVTVDGSPVELQPPDPSVDDHPLALGW